MTVESVLRRHLLGRRFGNGVSESDIAFLLMAMPKVQAGLDVERLGEVLYEMGVDDLDLSDARKLAANIVMRYASSNLPERNMSSDQ